MEQMRPSGPKVAIPVVRNDPPPQSPLTAPEPPPLAQVQIVTAAAGWPATVVVDGIDMSRHVDRIALDAEPMQIPRVMLRAVGDFSFDGAAIVTVGIPEPVDPLDWVHKAQKWLDAGVDWHAVQQSVAEGTMSSSVGDAVRRALLAELAVHEQRLRGAGD